MPTFIAREAGHLKRDRADILPAPEVEKLPTFIAREAGHLKRDRAEDSSPDAGGDLIGQTADRDLDIGPLFPPRRSEDLPTPTKLHRSSVRPAPTAQLQQSPPRYVAAVRPTDGRADTQKRTADRDDSQSRPTGAPACHPMDEPEIFHPASYDMRRIDNESSRSHGSPDSRHDIALPVQTAARAGSKRRASETPTPETIEPFEQTDSDRLELADFFAARSADAPPAPPFSRQASHSEPQIAESNSPISAPLAAEAVALDDMMEDTTFFFDEPSETPPQSAPAPSQRTMPMTEPVLAPPAEEEPWQQISIQPKSPKADALPAGSSGRGEWGPTADERSGEKAPAAKGRETDASDRVPQEDTLCPFLNGECLRNKQQHNGPAAAPQALDGSTTHPRDAPRAPSEKNQSAVRSNDDVSAGSATPTTTIRPWNAGAPSSSTSGRSEEIFRPPRLPRDGFGLRTDQRLHEVFQPTFQNSSRRMRTDASAALPLWNLSTSASPESWPMPGGPYSGAMFPFLPGQAFAEEERFVDPLESLHIDARALIGSGSQPSGADALSTTAANGKPVSALQGTQLQQIVSRDGTGLKGFCPVALRDERALKVGKPVYAAAYHGDIYFLASAEAQAAFERHPAKYAPVAHGYDMVVAAVTGELQEGSLDHAVRYQDRLYLFTSVESLKTFTAAPSAMAATQ